MTIHGNFKRIYRLPSTNAAAQTRSCHFQLAAPYAKIRTQDSNGQGLPIQFASHIMLINDYLRKTGLVTRVTTSYTQTRACADP